MKKNIFIVSTLFLAGVAISVNAQTANTGVSSSSTVLDTSTSSSTSISSEKRQYKPTQIERKTQRGVDQTVQAEKKYMRNDIKNERKDARGDMKDARKEVRDEQRGDRLEAFKRYVEITIKRLEAWVDREKKLIERVTSRIDKLASQNVDVTVARRHIKEATEKLTVAQAKIADIKLIPMPVIDATTTDKPLKDTKEKILNLVKEAKKAVQEAHKHISIAVSSLKPGTNKDRTVKTTTEINITPTTVSDPTLAPDPLKVR